jgi:hypothetical protein
MNRIVFFIFLTFSSLSFSQSVIEWEVSYIQSQNSIELKATLSDGWHLYSQHIENNVGPVPTTFSFESSNDFHLMGGVIEPKPIQKYDENFEATLDFFEKEVKFNQKIQANKSTLLEGTITYMVCNASMCLPPIDYKYKVEIKI